MYKIDLHSHSTLSKDGGITFNQYQDLLTQKVVDFIAITDHDEVAQALDFQKRLGNHIIVGEEIMTRQGEIIGLFLSKRIPPQQEIKTTLQQIHEQGGLAYVPHAFDVFRHGISVETATEYTPLFDIIEIFNPRNVTLGGNNRMKQWQLKTSRPGAASSDAHCMKEVGRSYSLIDAHPTRESLVQLLQQAQYSRSYAYPQHFFCPPLNKAKKFIHRQLTIHNV